MSREKWLLRASVPFLTFSALFAEGVPSAMRWLGVAGVLVMTAALWPRRSHAARQTKTDQSGSCPGAPPTDDRSTVPSGPAAASR
jgi:hypothetical protein